MRGQELRSVIFFTFIILLILPQSSKGEWQFSDFFKEWGAPFTEKKVTPYLFTGASITTLLVGFRDQIVEPFQKNISDKKPLGDNLAKFGYTMGNMVPNALYMGFMYGHYKFTKNRKSFDRALLMLKSSSYSGLTTHVLKQIVDQRRPNKGKSTSSFPSGHATCAFSFASIIGMEHEWYWGVGAYTMAAIVAISRMNDNAHYLHDVVFGSTIGLTYGLALYYQSQNKIPPSSVFYPIKIENGLGLGYAMDF